jgi:6-phosphofructokinase 1
VVAYSDFSPHPDFSIETLGPSYIESPLVAYRDQQGRAVPFVQDTDRILVSHHLAEVRRTIEHHGTLPSMELAGPRRHIFFEPSITTIGILTCGGLCPGLNNVIRSIVMAATHHYKISRIYGFQYGFSGLVDDDLRMRLTPDIVSEIHLRGGSILASSRGQQNPGRMVDQLENLGINILFVIGGDGSMRGALSLIAEIKRRGLKISIVGIPKTIDNDLRYIDLSFGYTSAYSKAVEAIECAHREAQGAANGIGLVKLMGRHSGFITCAATLAAGCVNYSLIPEVPFKLEGERGLLQTLKKRLLTRNHAVIVVAEGAGQELVEGPDGAHTGDTDASGNRKLLDIGTYLANQIKDYFKSEKTEINLKYIDPSYIIRSVPACPADAIFCANLGLNAVHAAMSGKTSLLIGQWQNRLVHIPIYQAIAERNCVDTTGALWLSVLESTGQPLAFQ